MDRKLLIVDDETNIQKSLKRLLRREEYHIHTVGSGYEALEYLKDNKVHVVLSDQRMPHMTGTELFEQIKSLYPDIVRIVLSGYTDLKSITDSINEGAIFKFLTKPWDDEQLKNNIRDAFENYEMAHENDRLNDEINGITDKLEQVSIENKLMHLYRDVVDSLNIGVIAINDDGEIKVFNSHAKDMLSIQESSVDKNIQSVVNKNIFDSFVQCKNSHKKQGGTYGCDNFGLLSYEIIYVNNSFDEKLYIMKFQRVNEPNRVLYTENMNLLETA